MHYIIRKSPGQGPSWQPLLKQKIEKYYVKINASHPLKVV